MNIKWTLEEKEFIRNNAGFMKDKELAKKLTDKSGRRITVDALRKVRQKLGIKKKHGRGICALVYSPVEEAEPGLSKRENEGGSSQEVPD
jgi:hypothetical protein